MTAKDRGRATGKDRLLQLGAFLFLLGLLSGLVASVMDNPRMGLSAHLQGLMNGIFLLVLGLLWERVRLAPVLKGVAFWSFVLGTFGNWLSVQLAALWGTGAMMPLAAPGFQGEPWQEAIVSGGLVTITVAMLLGTGLLLAGLMRRPSRD